MNDLLTNALRWRVAIAECALLVFINMGTLAIATMQNWDKDYVLGLGWWNWFCIIVAILVSGCNTVIGFINKTFHAEKERIKTETDSGFYTKQNFKPISPTDPMDKPPTT